MSTTAIDTARTSESLSVFMSEIPNTDPIDNYFERFPLLSHLMTKKELKDGGRQLQIPYNSGENTTFKWFAGNDVFNTTTQDTALTIVAPYVNYGGSIVISWEEMREIAGKDHATFDLLKHRRMVTLNTAMKGITASLFAATQAADKFTSLIVGIDSTGTLHNQSASTDADWASKEVDSGSASFASVGLQNMRSLYNQITEDNAMPDTIVMGRTLYESYENEIDIDVRYSTAQGVGGRGFTSLEFKGKPILVEKACTANTIFMWDSANVKLYLDKEGDFNQMPFVWMPQQLSQVGLFVVRGNLVIDRRKSTGKIINQAA